MGTLIGVIIVLFVLGSMMALKPNGIDQRLDKLRMTARRLQLNPKLVACPDWIKVVIMNMAAVCLDSIV